MKGFQGFMWEGKPIENIEAWAIARGEKMIKAIRHTTTINILTGRKEGNISIVCMPESFWNSLTYGQENNRETTYEVLGSYLPSSDSKNKELKEVLG